MKDKERRKKEDADIFDIISTALHTGGGLISLLGEAMKDPRDVDKYHLGNGLYLLVDESIERNTSRYCKLVREDNSLVSDQIFRLGGLSHGFEKKPYCMLIVYPNFPKETWGNHCIIDKEGKIVLQTDKAFDSDFYYFKGVIATKNGVIYNLLTGQPIVKGNTKVESSQFYFVENKYDYEKKFEEGVYKIDKNTGEYEIFK